MAEDQFAMKWALIEAGVSVEEMREKIKIEWEFYDVRGKRIEGPEWDRIRVWGLIDEEMEMQDF